LCRRRALIQDLWSLWITLNIIDTITCPLGLPSPLEGLGLGVNPDARGGRHTSSARTARFGVPPLRVARCRPGRRDVVSRFPLLAPEARCGALRTPSQIKSLLPKFHRNRTRKYNNTALFGGGCWVSLTGRFHRHSAAGWAECTVAGPGRVRRHDAQFSERSSTPLIGHARVALSGVLTRLPSTQTDDTQRGGKGHKLLPAP